MAHVLLKRAFILKLDLFKGVEHQRVVFKLDIREVVVA